MNTKTCLIVKKNIWKLQSCNTLNPHEERKEFLFKWVVGKYLSVASTMLGKG